MRTPKEPPAWSVIDAWPDKPHPEPFPLQNSPVPSTDRSACPVYIYGLCEPGTTIVRYIGQTKQRGKESIRYSLILRRNQHLYTCRLKKDSILILWLRQLLSNKQKPNIILLDIGDENIWHALELFHIASHKRAGFQLLNRKRPPAKRSKGATKTKRRARPRNKETVVDIIEYNGTVFRRYPNSTRREDRLYYRGYVDGRGKRLHVAMWEDVYGPVPIKHVIHHIDGNALNNTIENLECVPEGEHMGIHKGMIDEEAKQRRREHIERIRPLTVAWHSSPEGLAWHSKNGREAWANRQPIVKQCIQCGRTFQSITKRVEDRFCSNMCKSAWRRASGVDDVERPCEVCGEIYITNKYSKARSCSPKCAGVLTSRNKLAKSKCHDVPPSPGT